MRILFVDPISHLLGQHDRAICEGLTRHGHEVTLVVNADYPFLGEPSGYDVTPIYGACVGDRPAAVKAFYFGLFVPRFRALVRRVRPDAVIFYYSLSPGVDGKWLAWLNRRGIRTVLCVHDVLPLNETPAHTRVFGSLYKAPWRLLTFSGFARNELVNRLHVSAETIRSSCFGVEWNGLDRSPAQPRSVRAQLGIDEKDKVILCFGQIKENKELESLFRAFQKALQSDASLRLLVVGRPRRADFDQFPKMAEELGIAARVHIRPYHVPEEEVPALLRAADVVVLPYAKLYQSAVLPLACRMRRPVVACQVGNISEVLEDGESGYLVPPGNPDRLCAALLEALGDPAEADRRCEKAYQSARNIYSWGKFCQTLDELLLDK